MISELPVVVPPPDDDAPSGLSSDHPMRKVTRQVAFEPQGWTAERRAKVADLFDSLASEWHTRDAPGRDAPLQDALERGLAAADEAAAGPALEAAMAAVTTTEVPAIVFDADGNFVAPGRPRVARPVQPSGRGTARDEGGAPPRTPRGGGDHFGFGGDDDDLPANDPPTGTMPIIAEGFHAGFVEPTPRRFCVDLGAGIGISSELLASRFPILASIDLSVEMLRTAPAEPALRIQGDGSCLPVADAAVDVLVLVNAFLFPTEVERIVSEDGVVVWVNSRGADTPIHLTADEVDAALPGYWDGVASQAGWGTWSVHWRS